MNWFYDLKIGSKLLTAFLLVAAIGGLIGWIGLSVTGELKARGTTLYAERLLPIRDLGYANAIFLVWRPEMIAILTAKDQGKRRASLTHIEEESKRVETIVDTYRRTTLGKEAQQALSRFQSAFERYKTVRAEAIGLAMMGQDAKALDIVRGILNDIQGEASKEILSLIEINAHAAEEEEKAAEAAAASARARILIFSGIGMLLALGLGLLVARIVGNPVRAMQAAAEKLALGDVNVTIDLDTKDELGALAHSFRVMAEVVKDRAALAQKIASGDLTVDVKANSEQDVLGHSFIQVVGALRSLVADTDVLAEAAAVGNLDARGNPEKFQGGYKQIVGGFNRTLDAILLPIGEANRVLAQISAGKIDELIARTYKGDHEKMKQAVNNVALVLQGLQKELDRLTVASRDGQLSERGKPDQFQGSYAGIVQGVNETLDAILLPIGEANRILAQISNGRIDESIAQTYKGDHEKMKQAVNNVAAVLQGLQKELGRLTEASREGQLSERGKADQFQGAYAGIVKGVNEMLDAILLPIGEGNRILGLVRGGNLREKVEIACEGDHEKMKQAVNGVRDWLSDLVSYVTKMANGDMTALMAKASEKDQIHEWLMLLKTSINTLVADAGMLAQAAAAGRVGTRADASKHQGAYRAIIEGVNQTLEAIVEPLKATSQNAAALASSSEELTAVSQQMAGNSEATATQANVVSAASEQISRNVASVASASEQMQASIREIAKNANESARVAKNAVSVAHSTNETVKKLGESSQEIGNVIKVITSIAQQTNLLALNATIEAARAGEAGKGFAVVANEVKELAKQTAKATEDIGQKIDAIQGDTKGAVIAIEEIGAIINQINDISNSIASAVEEQTVTTNEIGRSVNEAAKGVGDIAKNIGGVAVAAKNTTQGAGDMQKASQELSQMAARLQRVVSRFTF